MNTDSTTTQERTATDRDASTTNQLPSAGDLTKFRLDCLFVIAGYQQGRFHDGRHRGDAPHGLAIKDTLEGRYGKKIHHGRLYPNLDTLIDQGLVEKTELDRRTNGYELTDDGWELLHRRMQWTLGCIDGDTGGDER